MTLSKTNVEKLDDFTNNLKKYQRSNFASTLNPSQVSVFSSSSKAQKFNSRNNSPKYGTLNRSPGASPSRSPGRG